MLEKYKQSVYIVSENELGIEMLVLCLVGLGALTEMGS